MSKTLFEIIGQIVAYSSAIVFFAFLFFRFLGSRWIENKFAKSLEEYKALQAHDLEEVKSKITLLLTRTLKLHDKEYEVLPATWAKLIDAEIALEKCIAAFRQTPDFKRMDENDFEKFLKNSDLSDNEKDILTSSSDRNREYIKILEWRDLISANTAFGKFHDYLQKNRIFLRPDLKEKFDKIDDHIWSAWVSKKVGGESKNFEIEMKAYNTSKEIIKPLMKEIEDLVQSNLFPAYKIS